ncbi:AAA family ATPase [Candidatus Saccharibacteria bacterium]|nr:AAA family ATPase [Candidatus Saccharibacteria bacterium]
MEGNKKNKSRALMIFGAPCSGKTTFAKKFAKKFGLAYYDVNEMMEEHGLSRADTLYVLELIMQTKQTILIEGGIDTEKERSEMRNIMRKNGYEPALIWVQTDVATIRSRMKLRYRSVTKAKQSFDMATADMEAPTDFEKPIILSGKHTFETQTRHAITGLADLIESK